MNRLTNRTPDKQSRIVAGIAGGLAGAATYAGVQALDLKVFDHNTDDFVLLGRMFSSDDSRIQLIGRTMHFVNGAALGSIYGLVGRDRMPGSPLAKGITFAMLETIALYPISSLQRFHPGIRDGRLESYLTPVAFAQQVVRHIAFGAALGPVTDIVLKKT